MSVGAYGEGGGMAMGRRARRIEWAVALLVACAPPHATWADHPDWSRIEEVLIGEAAGEAEAGMYAVACVMRNRRWHLDGFSADRRPDLRAFVARQPRAVRERAHRVVQSVAGGGPDTTGGAHCFENVQAFDMPPWARGRTPTARIGRHTFWRI